jgi:hypothetical protein
MADYFYSLFMTLRRLGLYNPDSGDMMDALEDEENQ